VLKVSKIGFETYEQHGIVLSTDDRLSFDHTVATEMVSVNAAMAAVQTATSDRSDVVTGKQIEGILMQGRNVTGLVQLVGGTIGFYVQGSRSPAINVSIDGVMATDPGSAGSTAAVHAVQVRSAPCWQSG
jgi:hypothetical protein